MRRAIVICIGLLWTGSLWAGPPGGTATFTKLKLHIESHPVNQTIYHGYTAHRFTVHNSASEKRRLIFTLPARHQSHDDFNINYLTRSFTISPGTQTVTILQPSLPMGYNEEVKIRCERQERFISRGIGLRMADSENCGHYRPRVVLLSQGFNKPAMDKAVQALTPKGSGHGGHFSHGGGGPYSDTHAEFQYEADETAKWPRHWLAYSCYDMIVMKGEQWKRTPSDVRKALESWVLCGGKLAIFGEGFIPPKGWNKDSQKRITTHDIGLGKVREYNENELPSGGASESIAYWLGADDPENNQNSIPLLGGLQTAVNELHNDHWGGSERDFNSYFRVIGAARTPVRLVIIVLTLFVLIAGPVNLFILNRKGKRSWFLWTLPVISFATSGMVFVVSFFSEGVTPRLRTDSITILNQVEQEATTLGAVALYAPIAPSQLNFSGQSEVTPLFDSGYIHGPFGGRQNHDSGSNRQVEWSEGGEQRLTGKWIGSRVPAHFAVRKTEHREERIQVQWPGTKPEIINGLGGYIDQIYLAAPDGTLFGGQDIGPGKKVLLNPITGGLKSHPHSADDSSTTKLVNSIAKLASADDQDIDAISPEIVPANRYWARLSNQKNPFLENPLRGRTSKHKTKIHVVGILSSKGSAQ